MEGSVVNSGEVASSRWLVLFRAESKRVYVNTSVGVAGVVLPWLNKVEVGALTLRETVVAVKLELSGDYRVLAPAMHVEGGLGKDEGASIRYGGGRFGGGGVLVVKAVGRSSVGHTRKTVETTCGLSGTCGVVIPGIYVSSIVSTRLLEHTRGINESILISVGNGVMTTERVDSVREGIESIGVVERLGTKETVKRLSALPRGAVVNVLIRLDYPDKLLARVVEGKLDLVGRGTNRLIAGELELLAEVFVGVLRHTTTLIGVEEDVVNVEGSRYKGLVVSGRYLGATRALTERADSPEALLNRAEVNVELNLVVLESNKRESKSRVAAEPELKRNVEGGLRKGVTRGAYLARGVSLTWSIDVREGRVGDEGKLGGVTNHLEVTSLLFSGEGELHPDVHPVTVLAVNALSTNLNLNLRNKLVSREIEPTGVDSAGVASVSHCLVDFRKSYLKVGSVGKITITGNGACNTASEIGLSVESLLNRFHGKVGVTSVGYLPEGNLGVTGQIYILGSIGYEL